MTTIELSFHEAISLGDIEARLIYADWLEDHGRDTEAAMLRSTSRPWVLLKSVPSPFPNPGNGACEMECDDGCSRKAVKPGSAFDGREGRLGNVNTGWYQPVGFYPAETVEKWVASSFWDENSHEWTPGTRLACAKVVVSHYLCSGPWDFPGLLEHYPELHSQFLEELRV